MFKRKPAEKTGLDDAIDSALADLASAHADEDRHATIVKQLTKLYAMKASEKPDRVSKETLLIVAGNILGIVIITGHERANVITTKALSFMQKPR